MNEQVKKDCEKTEPENTGTCKVTINDDNPRWKTFACVSGYEFPHSMRDWKYCPYCGKEIEIEEEKQS